MSFVAEGRERAAITYDVSARGLRMACSSRLEVGCRIRFCFRLSPDDVEERSLEATITRVEENGAGEGPWRYRMAARFDEAHPEFEGVLIAPSDDVR